MARLLKHERGVTLLEGLIALGVVSVGLLGMARLDTQLQETSGQAKARLQAVRLAHAKLAELRGLATRGAFDALASLPRATAESLVGYSTPGAAATAFARWWSIDGANADPSRRVAVNVAWVDRAGIERLVKVDTVLAWDPPARGGALLAGNSAGKAAPTPSGRASAGNGTTITVPATPPNADGLWVTAADDGRYRLIDATGRVLLSATVAGEAFSNVRGAVYVDQADPTFASRIDNDDVFVVSSVSGFCALSPAKGATPPNALLPLPSTGTAAYRYFTYSCYFGADWYGNIGVVRASAANTNERVCVGDPAVAYVSPSLKSDNRHPSLGTVRAYRGFSGTAPYYASSGIGTRGASYTAAQYNGHDFVLTRIGGVPMDADCSAPLQRVTSPANPFSASGNATVMTPLTETAYLHGGGTVVRGNPGKAFCLSESCPEDGTLEPPLPVTIRVTGTVERVSARASDRPTLASLVTNSGTCTLGGGTGGNAYTFDCSFTGAGFSAGQWSGEITARTAAGEFVCASGVVASPAGSTVGPATPAPETFTFSYAAQSIGVTPTLQFRIGKTAEDC